jgi:hypothetical protein
VQTIDLPREIYYWNVVHPSLTWKRPISSFRTAAAKRRWPPAVCTGATICCSTWRATTATPRRCTSPASTRPICKSLSPSAVGYLSTTIHNFELAYVTGTKNVVFTEFAFGAGTVYATTL